MVNHNHIIGERATFPYLYALNRGDGNVGVKLAVHADLNGPAVSYESKTRARLGPLAEDDSAAVAKLKRGAFEALYD